MEFTNNGNKFILPQKNSLVSNGPDDPLPYYYHPIMGPIYQKRISQSLSLLIANYGNILEIGYGSGIMMPSLCSMGSSVKGIDLESDPKKILSTLKKLGCFPKLINGRAEKMPYKNNEFDLVVAISIMEHIKNFKEVIDEVFRVLKPGGHFLVGMPRVSKSMEYIFDLICYPNIEEFHVTNHEKFRQACKEKFTLVKEVHIPNQLPASFGFYFNMLFEKPK